jgi:cytochrome c2
MNMFELNKIFGAATGALLIYLLANFFVEELYHLEAPEELAYGLEIEEPEVAEAGAEPQVDFAALLQQVSAEDGAGVFRKCSACHAVEEGVNGVGPNLYDVVGRDVASAAGYDYSGALVEQAAVWDFEALNGFLENPGGWAPGTKMGFAGLGDPEDRAAVIVYLNDIGGTPEPLPEVAAAAEGGEVAEEAVAATPLEEMAEAAEEAPAGGVEQDPQFAAEGREAVTGEGSVRSEPVEAGELGAGMAREQLPQEGAEAAGAGGADASLAADDSAQAEAGGRRQDVQPAGGEQVEVDRTEAGAAEAAMAEAVGEGDDPGRAAPEISAALSQAAREINEDEAPGEGRSALAAAAGDAPARAEPADLATALAQADAEAGAAAFEAGCSLCHALEPQAHGVGPSLHGVIGREIGGAEFSGYSDALENAEGRWTVAKLDAYLAAGEAAMGGHSYGGEPSRARRADILAYIHRRSGGEGALAAELGAAPETGAGAEAAEAPDVSTPDAPEATVAVEEPETDAANRTPGEAAIDLLGADELEREAAELGDAVEEEVGEATASAEEAGTEALAAVEGAAGAVAEDVGEAAEAVEQAVTGEAEAPDAAEVEVAAAAPAGGFAAAVSAASAEDGAKLFRQCQACHQIEEGRNMVGPSLYDVLGREIASVEGFRYSEALAGKDGEWDFAAMSAFLENPREWAPGTKMVYRGLPDEADRAAIVKYLNEQDPDPLPYP